jgi:hypothetical protein
MAKFSSLAEILKNASPDFLELNGFVRKPSRKPQEQRKAEKQPTGLELNFLYFWRLCGGRDEDWQHEAHIFPDRPRMHVDFYSDIWKVAVEIDGGQWSSRAGHNSGKGVARDAQKLAMCNLLGVTLFRLPTSSVDYDEVMNIWEFVTKGETNHA